MVALERPVLAVYAAVIALASAACGPAMVPPSDHPLMREGVRARTEVTLAGDRVALPVPGHVTVIDFWSTTCKPCAELMPEVEALYEDEKGAGVKVVGIAVDDNPGLVIKRTKERGVTYPTVMDADSQIEGAYRVTDLPQTFVFDRKGSLRFFAKGAESGDVKKIREAVEALRSEH